MDDAEWLKKTAAEIKSAVMATLWSNEDGCFYNHIDLQNIPHRSHYYTDHIFSTLYSSIDTFTNWQSLYYLRKTLIEKDPDGKPSLMRVGTLKGRLFGNDNIMPTQMAEAARAFYKIGDKDQATWFLESVARAGTIFTEGPGNFPERMNDLGKGEANYLFGNPIGSYIHSVINGLFGLEVVDMGNTLHWQPGFPDTWDHANLKLSYANVSYTLKAVGAECHAFYAAEYPVNRALRFSVFLPPCKVLKALCNGKEIDYEIHPGLNRIELNLKSGLSLSHKLELIYVKSATTNLCEMSVVQGSLNQMKFNQPIAEVIDPQSILNESAFVENILKFKIGKKPGQYEFFVKLKNPDYYVPVNLNIIPEFVMDCDTAYYDAANKTLLIKAKLLFDKKGVNKYTVDALFSDLHQVQNIDSNTGDSLKFVFENFPLPCKSTECINFRISNEVGKAIDIQTRVVIKGIDDQSVLYIYTQRMNNLRSIDISPFFNAHSYLNMFPWGRDELLFNLSLTKNGEAIKTQYGNFTYTPSTNKVALIELGRSDSNNRKTVPTQYSSKVEIPVGASTSEVDLLYFSEVESRNTGARVGKITLVYANGDSSIVPLAVGKNIDFVRSYIAKDAFPLFVSENLDQIVSYSADKKFDICCRKHLNFLPIQCDKTRNLKSVQISVEAADVQFGLIGVNYLTN